MRWRPKVWHASLDRSREQPRFFSYSEPTVTTKSTSASQGGPVDPVWYPLDLADCSLEPTARRGGVESSHDSPLEGGVSCELVSEVKFASRAPMGRFHGDWERF